MVKFIHIVPFKSKCHQVYHKSVIKPYGVSCGSCVGCFPCPSIRLAVDYITATRKLKKGLFSSAYLPVLPLVITSQLAGVAKEILVGAGGTPGI